MNKDKKQERKKDEVSQIFRMYRVDLPDEIPNEVTASVLKRALLFHFIYSIIGLVLGLACIIGGIGLLFAGIGGSTSWVAKALGLTSELSDAPPGVFLFVVGVFLVFITRFGVHMKK